jgi:hypothetical protein
MDPGILALVSGLIGALIGASASVITITIQNHYQTKREMQKIAIEIAMEEYQARVKGEFGGIKPTSGPILVAFYSKLVKLSVDDDLNPESIQALFESQIELTKAYSEAYDRFIKVDESHLK